MPLVSRTTFVARLTIALQPGFHIGARVGSQRSRCAGTRKSLGKSAAVSPSVSASTFGQLSGRAVISICSEQICCALPNGFQHCASTRASKLVLRRIGDPSTRCRGPDVRASDP